MYIDWEKRLHKSIIKFKKRADIVHPQWSEMHDNGEWEIGLYEFDEMCNIIFEASEQMLDDILFGIARDNECSRITGDFLWYF